MLGLVLHELRVVRRMVALVLTRQGIEMGDLTALAEADAELAGVVTDLVNGVNRIDADFLTLKQALAGDDQAAIDEEVAKVEASLEALKSARDAINTTDPAPVAVEAAPDGSGDPAPAAQAEDAPDAAADAAPAA